MSEIVLSGIRATGRLHFGNFLGAVKNFVNFQGKGYSCLYFVADWHTLTTLQDPEKLHTNLREIVKDYIAAGLDPEKSMIYAQSSVPEIAELCLLLSMMQPLGDLQRIPTFKELVRKHPDNVNLGLITYPVLMAADILGPKATIVPVGSDQVPNVELAQELARRFNNRFGETLALPRMMEQMARVPGLDGEKMGKSEAENAVDISLPINVIGDLYMRRGITDPARKRREDPGDPYNACRSVYPVHELVTAGEANTRTMANACQKATIGCVECKRALIASLGKLIVPFQERRAELAEKDDYITEVLHEGGKRARTIIAETTAQVRDKMGISVY